MGSKNSQTTPATTSTPSIRQLLGAADAHTAHPATFSTAPGTPTTGLRERGNDMSKSTGRSGRQNAATQRNMRRDERVTVQGPVKKQQPDGMSHGGWGVLSFCRLTDATCIKTLAPLLAYLLPRRGWGGAGGTHPPFESRPAGPQPPPVGDPTRSTQHSDSTVGLVPPCPLSHGEGML